MGAYVCRECRDPLRSYAELRDHARKKHTDRWRAIQEWAAGPWSSRTNDPAWELTHRKEAISDTFDADSPALEALKRAALARRKG